MTHDGTGLSFPPQHWIYDMDECLAASKKILLKHLKKLDKTKPNFEHLYSLKKDLNHAINKAYNYSHKKR